MLVRRIGLLLCVCFLLCNAVSARHIKGGWVQYQYVGAGTTTGTSIYNISMYVFRDCSQNGPMPSALGIYDAVSYQNVLTIQGTTSLYISQGSITKTYFDPCLSATHPTPCYQVFKYTTTVTLPNNANGFIIAAQDANRVAGIENISSSSSTGISFTGTIPGVINNTDYHVNSSPDFIFKDTALICYNAKFNYQFSATDADNDSLSYSFGNAINGVSTLTAPPYASISYNSGYAGISPLGPSVTIDPVTGLISGIAPATTGEYVIAVYVHEWRGGVMINSTRKELQVSVGNCSLSAASLKPEYINCNTFDFTFQNESAASNINSYLWDFGVQNSITDVSTSPTPTYTYADTGLYTIKLSVSNTGGCRDSATAAVRVYPGFTPSFTVSGSCYQSPFQFNDNSFVKYGTASWSWDLGDINTADDTSSLANPSYQYIAAGDVTVVMNISSSKGCTGSVSKTVTVNEKPFIKLAFTDTLICSIDSLPLNAQSSGVFQWTPNYKISNTAVLNPVVYPKDTTTYTLTVTDKGCIDSAKVKVNVLNFITVKLGLDTGICKTDSIILRPVSDALSYKWRDSNTGNSLSSYAVKYPSAAPSVATTYYVTANLGYCQDSAKIKVNVSPYPKSNAGNDITICSGSRAQLNASITGSYFTWGPVASLININTLSPIAGPGKTTSYILTVSDTLYCPKPVSDTIIVKVIPPIVLNAGKDISVTLNQPVDLIASGSEPTYTYQWTPASFLSNASIYNPTATITSTSIDSIRYLVKVTSPDGCVGSDDIIIHVYKDGPEIYVPTGFTPNGDGLNDVLRPVLAGITVFDYFNVYNEWGQLIYSTSERNKGWDGTYKGVLQKSGTYVFMTQGKDFEGKNIFRKGTTVLIR